MAVSVCLHLAHNEPHAQQWDYVLANFQPDGSVYLFNTSDLEVPRSEPLVSATFVATAANLPTEPALVVLAPQNGKYIQGDQSIVDYTHPADVIYLLGPDIVHLTEDDLGGRVPDAKVFIPTDTIDNMWSWVAYAVAMWDRRSKVG